LLKPLPPGSATHVKWTMASAVAVCNVAGALHAIDGIARIPADRWDTALLTAPSLPARFMGGSSIAVPDDAWETT
jgi:hypothetical protein